MKVIIKKNNIVLAQNVKVAQTYFAKLKGLMFIKEMKGMDGLIIEDCKSIHNMFVRFPIDAIFLNRDNQVVKVLRSFKPWRWSWIYFSAKRVLELPAQTTPDDLVKGDQLEVLGV